MPINQDEWSKGKILSKLKPTVIKFLEGNRSQAFTDVEIMESLKQNNQNVSSQDFLTGMDSLLLLRQKLKELISEEVIESKLIEIEDSSPMMYYKFK